MLNPNIKFTTSSEITQYLMQSLDKWSPKLWHEAKTGSIYIKFPHWGLGSIRIGDHNSRAHYHYKWEVRLDLPDNIPFINSTEKGWMFKANHLALQTLTRMFDENASARNIMPGCYQTWEQFKKIHTPAWKERKYIQKGIICKSNKDKEEKT